MEAKLACPVSALTFIYKYIAFKTRKSEYLKPENTTDFDKVIEIVRKEGLDYLVGIGLRISNARMDKC